MAHIADASHFFYLSMSAPAECGERCNVFAEKCIVGIAAAL